MNPVAQTETGALVSSSGYNSLLWLHREWECLFCVTRTETFGAIIFDVT